MIQYTNPAQSESLSELGMKRGGGGQEERRPLDGPATGSASGSSSAQSFDPSDEVPDSHLERPRLLKMGVVVLDRDTDRDREGDREGPVELSDLDLSPDSEPSLETDTDRDPDPVPSLGSTSTGGVEVVGLCQ